MNKAIIRTGTDKLVPVDAKSAGKLIGCILPEKDAIRAFPIEMHPGPARKTEERGKSEEENQRAVELRFV